MKDSIKVVQKVLSVINFTLIILIFSSCGSTNRSRISQELYKEEYKIINTFFTKGIKDNIYLHKKFFIDTKIARYFNSKNIDSIIESRGIPSYISEDTLKVLLNKKVREEFHTLILSSKKIKIDKNRILSENLKLTNKKEYLISLPLIIDDLAIFCKQSKFETPVFIMQKKKGKWKIIYTFYDKLILI
ncbi:hypothetical protein TOREUM_20242 [Tenacibaculum litoreum]|uniref:hypothetical protein n=1 Tax=Tenacibaculum litoreum TaxID=321269 RepID=UPI003894BE38